MTPPAPQVWDADTDINAEIAARLIAAQFPDFADLTLTSLGIGWDNAAFQLGDDWVFRFPRRRMGADLLAREVRFLSAIVPPLPLPISVPHFIGTAAHGYPYPWAGYRYLPGTTADRAALTDAERAANAPALAHFLSALHTIPLDDATRRDAPTDDIRRADLPFRVPRVRALLETLAPSLSDDTSLPALLDTLERLAQAPPLATAPVWVHGDLYPRHLLLSDTGTLSGVIDWGDMHLGDPALDLSIAFTFLPVEARAAFRAAYEDYAGPLDDATWNRARFRALSYGALLLNYGLSISDTAMQTMGHRALSATLNA